MLGERLTTLVSFEQLKLAAAAVLLSPFLPLLFMGEEYGETAPFLYFVSHSDADLIEAVRNGRRREFSAFAWQGTPPDPQDEATFLQSILNHDLKQQEPHSTLYAFYRHLLQLRKSLPSLRHLSKAQMEVTAIEDANTLCLRRWHADDQTLLVLAFSSVATTVKTTLPQGAWQKILDSSEAKWRGPQAISPESLAPGETLPMSPHAAVLYLKAQEQKS